jgi:hypothetical protein
MWQQVGEISLGHAVDAMKHVGEVLDGMIPTRVHETTSE